MLSRGILPLRSIASPSLVVRSAQWTLPSIIRPDQVRHGSMKVKRVQKKQPLEKNRIRRLIKGTKLEVKKEKKKKKKRERNTDPNAYIDVKPVEFDPYDLRGRSTLKVIEIT